jgi:hypothetical protein
MHTHIGENPSCKADSDDTGSLSFVLTKLTFTHSPPDPQATVGTEVEVSSVGLHVLPATLHSGPKKPAAQIQVSPSTQDAWGGHPPTREPHEGTGNKMYEMEEDCGESWVVEEE